MQGERYGFCCYLDEDAISVPVLRVVCEQVETGRPGALIGAWRYHRRRGVWYDDMADFLRRRMNGEFGEDCLLLPEEAWQMTRLLGNTLEAPQIMQKARFRKRQGYDLPLVDNTASVRQRVAATERRVIEQRDFLARAGSFRRRLWFRLFG